MNRFLDKHPLPWIIDIDWTVEVHDANGKIVDKFMNYATAQEFIEVAERVDVNNKIGAAQVKELLKDAGIEDDEQ